MNTELVEDSAQLSAYRIWLFDSKERPEKNVVGSQLVPNYVHMRLFVHFTVPILCLIIIIAHSFGTETCIKCYQILPLCKGVVWAHHTLNFGYTELLTPWFLPIVCF